MQDANIFVGSLIFIEELADKVLLPFTPFCSAINQA